jgi:predicted DNA repair protein MutK
MSGGLVALLDDVAAMARIAAASVDDIAAGSARAGAKAAGVIIDDAAVTPQYVTGVKPARELPMIWRIARGSLINKLLIILPVLLILSTFVPWILTPLLMLGGAYLSYEGAHKVWEKLRGRHAERTDEPSQVKGKEAEDKVVRGAITTDFILSCEIMVISLNEVAAESLIARAIILVVVAIGITVLVYGAVALIVKMDDVGLAMTKKDGAGAQKVGHGLVAAMPRVLDGLAFIGTFATWSTPSRSHWPASPSWADCWPGWSTPCARWCWASSWDHWSWASSASPRWGRRGTDPQASALTAATPFLYMHTC